MKNNNIFVNDVKIIYKNEDGKDDKGCFCVGPQNCNNTDCKIVQEYRERQSKKI